MRTDAVAYVAVIAFVATVAVGWLGLLYARERRARSQLRSRFAGVIDADAELVRVQGERDAQERASQELATRYAVIEKRYAGVTTAEEIVGGLEGQALRLRSDIERTREQYREKKSTYDSLVKEIAIFDERLAFAEMGVYEPHFDFSDSERYRTEIEDIRQRQKDLVADEAAVVCGISWSVDGSEAKGRTMTSRAIKLTLRAFNGECDAAIANTRWNNVVAMGKRIDRAVGQIDKLNASNQVSITPVYAELKRKELFLTHEYREKLKAEKEERAEAARASREEQKLLRDIEAAEEAEARYQRLLGKANADAAKATGARLDALEGQIRMLEGDLAEAHAKVERAQALAERTRSGYVYIISNVGSFGKDVVKIGLTRRLDPLDRVRELGDASVPFVFDTHAIIYSDDAPSLERALHSTFEKTRVNVQNYRKEFFRASIDDVEAAVRRLAPDASFIKDVEAQEYQETLARRQSTLAAAGVEVSASFPSTI
ncbi:chromosome partitioning protein ParA [Methylobacterium sp. Leaf100]|nr:chromosome partitioning protein ParA [Methylobacterium sp. Leaf100]